MKAGATLARAAAELKKLGYFDAKEPGTMKAALMYAAFRIGTPITRDEANSLLPRLDEELKGHRWTRPYTTRAA